MSKLSQRGDTVRNGLNGTHPGTAALPGETWPDEDVLQQEVDRLQAENQHLMGLLAGGGGGELEALRSENAELRARLEELEQVVLADDDRGNDAATAQAKAWEEQQREYEAILEEKSEVIRSLHQKLQEMREHAAAPPPPEEPATPVTVTDKDLLRQKAELDSQRQQLEEDETTLMEQMRQMEMTMARERAEMARQRSELQRLHADLRREIEVASRDGALRERLQSLQRR